MFLLLFRVMAGLDPKPLFKIEHVPCRPQQFVLTGASQQQQPHCVGTGLIGVRCHQLEQVAYLRAAQEPFALFFAELGQVATRIRRHAELIDAEDEQLVERCQQAIGLVGGCLEAGMQPPNIGLSHVRCLARTE